MSKNQTVMDQMRDILLYSCCKINSCRKRIPECLFWVKNLVQGWGHFDAAWLDLHRKSAEKPEGLSWQGFWHLWSGRLPGHRFDLGALHRVAVGGDVFLPFYHARQIMTRWKQGNLIKIFQFRGRFYNSYKDELLHAASENLTKALLRLPQQRSTNLTIFIDEPLQLTRQRSRYLCN